MLFSFLRYLKPDIEKKSKHKTAVMKKTLNPEFNEVRTPPAPPQREMMLMSTLFYSYCFIGMWSVLLTSCLIKVG